MFSISVFGRMTAAVSLFAAMLPAPAIASEYRPEVQGPAVLPLALPAINKVDAPASCLGNVTNVNTGVAYCYIQEANDAPATLDGHVISVTAGSYTNQMSTITKSLTIIGDGAGVTLDGMGSARLMTSTAAWLSLENITMTNGYASSNGGCLNASGYVTLLKTAFVNCKASYSGGGARIGGSASITASQFTSNTGGNGGGAYVNGNASIADSQFISNSVNEYGGGVYVLGNASIADSQFISNTTNQNGGGAVIKGKASITASQFTGNTATGGAAGALIYSTASITASQFTSNIANLDAGAALLANASITASQFTSNTASQIGGGAHIYSNASITASQFISNTAASGYGGGVGIDGSASIADSLFASNTSGQNGGGAYIYSNASITASQFTSNTAKSSGGGAIIGGSASIAASQFTSNTANEDGGAVALYSASGGQIYNNLFVRNVAQSGAGDAIYLYSPRDLDVVMANGLESPLSKSDGPSLDIAFNTIASPTLAAGSAIYLDSDVVAPVVRDTIIL